MAASILAHGLMQNLVVTEAQKGRGRYYVVAGARRLAAMNALQNSGKLPKDYTVSCQVVEDDKAVALSLAENTVREAMHPLDEFEAFAALAEDHTTAEIDARFGKTEQYVLQRLNLGRVAKDNDLCPPHSPSCIFLLCIANKREKNQDVFGRGRAALLLQRCKDRRHNKDPGKPLAR